MSTKHQIINQDASHLTKIPDQTIALVVTSPPYPMIEMWDESFSSQNKAVKDALSHSDYKAAFNEMHRVLEAVWVEMNRVLINSGFICINIGDATRNNAGQFQLYPNHARIISFFEALGYSILPDIHWRKQTNSPNKFLGSGMYPAGAYVTYEHEYILIFRKGGKREFKTAPEKQNRRESAYFWEERNVWFSDLWDFKGTSQIMNGNGTRKRSGAFPFQLAYQLINMYSIKGDTVLDPFVGTGTTNLAAMASERNSIGVDIEEEFCQYAKEKMRQVKQETNQFIESRVDAHHRFVESQEAGEKSKFYTNTYHGFEVKTRQEKDLLIRTIDEIIPQEDGVTCIYSDELIS